MKSLGNPAKSSRVGMVCLLGALVGVTVEPASVRATDDVVVIEAVGEGVTNDEALNAALRNALEKGGQQEIFSDSQVENFQLMHDTIITRAQGIVKDYEIISQQKVVGGSVRISIKAKVSKSVLAQSWGEIQNVLMQLGRPKIMVSIVERIDGNRPGDKRV